MIFRFYLYIAVVNLVLEMILFTRLLKYRKEIGFINEVMTTLYNSFCPIVHIKNLISCGMMIFSSKESMEIAATILDYIEMEGRK